MKYLDDFESYLNDRKSPLTMKNYLNTIEHYLLFLRDRQPDESNAEEFLTYQGHKGRGARSLNRDLAALKSFFKHVLRKELNIESYRFDKKLPEWLTEDEQKKYRAACNTPFEKALVITFLGAGLRVSEIAGPTGLEIDNIDPDGFLKVFGKGGKERVVKVKLIVIEAINEYLGIRKDHSTKVFPRGTRVVEHIIREIGIRAKINKKVTPHVLRHSMGSLWMDKGGDLAELRDQLGHTNIATTNIYVHTKPSKVRVPL